MLAKVLVTAIITLAGAILQATLFNYLGVGGARPSLMLIISVFFGLQDGPLAGAVVGFACGLVEDSLSSGPMGVNALARTLLGFIVGSIRGRIFRDTLWYRISVLFLASLLGQTMPFAILYVLDRADSFLNNFRNIVLLSALYNTLLGSFLFFLFDRLLRKYWLPQKRT
jgi:rod shape-determining protein MreD